MRRRVALKVLGAVQAGDPILVERFHREGRAAACLDHPNIVRAFDIGSHNDMHYLVLEYVDGMNLHDFVQRNGPLDVARACHCASQVALGLQHAHENGLIHRDIKPANVLIDRQGVVKVLDLGLARFNKCTDQLTQRANPNSTVLGTADFLSPEQALDCSSVDIRADIYSLGATFCYLLTGHGPFPEGSLMKKLYYHQTTQPKPPSHYRSEVSPELDEVILRLLAKNPDDRYQTPIEVAQALEPWTQQSVPLPTEAEMPLRYAAESSASSSHPHATPRSTSDSSSKSLPPGKRPRITVDQSATWSQPTAAPAEDTATGKTSSRRTRPIRSAGVRALTPAPIDPLLQKSRRDRVFLWIAGLLLFVAVAGVSWVLLG
jgi:serine/threonine protein kinase